MDLKQYNRLFNDAWQFFKNYASRIPMTEADWMELIPMLDTFTKRHPDHEEFARAMILTVEHELEVQDKTIRKKEETWET